MPHQTDDAQLPADLPPNPFASSTPTPPKQRSKTAIDLTSSPKSPQEPSIRQCPSDNTRPESTSKRRVSDDERRLTGDFDVPADRVIAPDPRSYFRPSRSMGKPGSSSAFQPGLNTLDDTRRAPSGLKNITYGKSRNYAPGRGTVGNGQAAFEDFYSSSPATPASNALSRPSQTTYSVRVSPTKRRKTETNTTPQIIELLDDDEVEEVGRPDRSVLPALRKTQQSPQPVPAQSRHSAGSRSTSRKGPAGLTSANEFLGNQAFLKSSRRPAKKGLQQDLTRVSSRRSSTGSAAPQDQTTPINSLEDEDMLAARTSRLSNSNPRRAILKECKQGVQEPHIESGDLQRITSRHFENARINESTSDRERPITTPQQTSGTNDGLRSFRRAANTNNLDPYSDDELGRVSPETTMAAPLRTGSPSRSARTANSGVRRMSKAQQAAQGWPLISARTYDFDSSTTTLSRNREHPLILRHAKDFTTLEVSVWMDKYGAFTKTATINTRSVIKCWADDLGRIRLEGSRIADGTQPISDLQFRESAHFREFRDKHASSYCATSGVIMKDEELMERMFSKPLPKKNEAKRSPLAQDVPHTETATRSSRAQAAGTSIWDGLKTGTQRTLPAAANRGLAESSDTTTHARVSTRPTRTTRATAPTHDTDEPDRDHEVQRFSVVHGLGTPWVKELTFGEGRQRAQVIFEDLIRLDEGEFLNDNLINFYMTYLFRESKVSPSKVHLFNTFFYNRLKQNTGRECINYEAVRRWTRNDIFIHDYIVVPINEDIHWYLAIICNVGNIARKAIEEDFDEPTPNKTTDPSGAPANDGNALQTESRTAEGSDAPATCADSTTVCADDDTNLFDEESQLNLVDRDATQTAEKQSDTINGDLPRSSAPQQGPTRATLSIFVQPTSKTVLSNLHASPEKKKSKKRRSMAPRRDPTQPVVIILDSLSQTRTPAVRALKDWIAAEGKAKRGMEAVIKEKGLYPKGDQIPTQSNFSDCGVYLLGYAEKFFKDPDEFTRKLLTGEMTPDEDWPQLKPKEMRINLRDIIFAIAEEQELTVPTKKEKGKKSAVMEKSSPVKADTRASGFGLPSPLSKQQVSDVEKSCAVPPQTTSTVNDPTPSNARGDATAARPRLVSPFSYKKTEKIASPGIASSRAIRSASSTKTESTTPHQDHLHGRRTNPEVRISRRASPVKEGRENAHVAPGIAATTGENSLHRGPKARSASPLKRTTHRADGVEHRSTPEKSTTSLDAKRELNNENKSSKRQHSDGHSNHPIEILDSQEASHTNLLSPSRTKMTSPAVRKQPSRSPVPKHTLRHEPSLVEIPSFPPQVPDSQSQQTEDEFVGSQLVARLDADDAQRARAASAGSGPPTTPSLARKQSDPDIMEVDSQGNDPMDTAEDRNDDVIRETPEAARRSPSVLTM